MLAKHGLAAALSASPGLASDYGQMPSSSKSALQPGMGTHAEADPTEVGPDPMAVPKEPPPQSCFHFASRFYGTLRLAHMLYSLARVSRRDRWGWIVHHSVLTPDGATRMRARPSGIGNSRTAEARTKDADQKAARRTRIVPELVFTWRPPCVLTRLPSSK